MTTLDSPEQASPIEDPQDQILEGAAPTPAEPENGIVWSNFLALLGLFAFLLVVGGINVVIFVLALVAVLVIHEAGHFFVGRWSGMKVTEYFVGFGPRIFSWTRGETTYGLKAIPAGAYVRIIGMNNLEDVDPVDEPRTYRQAAWHKRVLTILAGPATHFVLAFGLMALFLAGQGRPIPADLGWGVGEVIPFSAAESAGLERADRILTINGIDTTQFEDLLEVIPDVSGEEVTLEVQRDTELFEVDVVIGERLTDAGARGFSGLYIGDLVVAFDGQPVQNYAEFASLAQERIGEQVEVDVVFGGSVQTELITVDSVLLGDEAISGFLGVSLGPGYEPVSGFEAVTAAPGEVGSIIREIGARTPRLVSSVDGLRSLFGLTAFDDPPAAVGTSDVEFRPVDGNFDENRPISLIGITALASALDNPFDVLFLLIVLNLFFGLFNLVPLLPLDGGHIALATYERVRSIGRKAAYHADAAKLLPVTYVVVSLLLVVSVIAMVRDVFDFIV